MVTVLLFCVKIWYCNTLLGVSLFQVIQQQQLLQTNQPSVLFNPETQTKIIYRVVYPSDIHRTGRTAPPVAHGRKRLHRSLDGADVENSAQDGTPRAKAKKMRHRRTRSGRVCRPPQYMVKDYKHIPTVDFEVEANDDAGTGYSDFRESSGDEAAGGDNAQKKTGGAFDFDEAIPMGEIDSYGPGLYHNVHKP